VNRSRVSVLTSVRRSEIKRLLSETGETAAISQVNEPRTERVINAWMSDRRYADCRGMPRRLPIRGSRTSFESLVRGFAGDVPPRALLEELHRLRVVREKGGQIELVRPAARSESSARAQDVIDALLEGLDIVASKTGINSYSRLR